MRIRMGRNEVALRLRAKTARHADDRSMPIQGRTSSMAPESWLVVTVAAAFLLLGIAASRSPGWR